MRIGAHVRSSGGISKAVDRAAAIGAETLQAFASSPRAWAFKPPSETEVLAFREKSEDTGIGPAFLHGIYLLNMGGPPELVEKSIDSLTNHMNVAGQIGAAGVIFHAGNHQGAGLDGVLDQVVTALKEVLDHTPPETWLIIENAAGMGTYLCASFGEVGRLAAALDNPRVRVCLDTQHSFASGYDVSDKNGIEAAMEEFDKEIGLSRLVAVHANDSKVKLGSSVDRHENIGDGEIGTEGFETIVGHAAFRDVPFLLEVPGVDKGGPDKENLDRLKGIRSRLGMET